ncbi:MAG: GNAT family N-acetyltransferase [Thiobacillus sp.]|nr:GNAT family N-acetyltransferase [Thiobacillus sp.]
MHEAPLQIRRLKADDIDAVSTLARTVWQATYPSLITQAQIDSMLADRYRAACIHAQLDDPRHAWWIAHHKQVLAGFAHASLEGAGCKLDKLYVHPDQQRLGIGHALLLAVQHWARQQQANRLWLQVNRGNARAIAAYGKYGFRITESRVFELGNGFVMDDHIMERAL